MNVKLIKESNIKSTENKKENYLIKDKKDINKDFKNKYIKIKEFANKLQKTYIELDYQHKKEYEDNNNKLKVSPDNNLSLDDNNEFNTLFNNVIPKKNDIISRNEINNQLNLDENFENYLNENDSLENNNLKPKNSMKIKFNLDLNTVELNSKFVYFDNNENQNNEFQLEEEENNNLFDGYDDEKLEHNYENENDQSQIDVDEDLNDDKYDENRSNCVTREKSTIITIPNMNFPSDQNYDLNYKKSLKDDNNENKLIHEKSINKKNQILSDSTKDLNSISNSKFNIKFYNINILILIFSQKKSIKNHTR